MYVAKETVHETHAETLVNRLPMEAGKSDALFIFIAFLHHTCVTKLHACMRQTARGQAASSIVDSKRLETVSVTDSVVALIQVLVAQQVYSYGCFLSSRAQATRSFALLTVPPSLQGMLDLQLVHP